MGKGFYIETLSAARKRSARWAGWARAALATGSGVGLGGGLAAGSAWAPPNRPPGSRPVGSQRNQTRERRAQGSQFRPSFRQSVNAT